MSLYMLLFLQLEVLFHSKIELRPPVEHLQAKAEGEEKSQLSLHSKQVEEWNKAMFSSENQNQNNDLKPINSAAIDD